ncbi:unnamed protein product [Prunus armeniaca]
MECLGKDGRVRGWLKVQIRAPPLAGEAHPFLAVPICLSCPLAHASRNVSCPCLLSFYAVLSAHGSTASSCIPEHGVHFDGLTDWA